LEINLYKIQHQQPLSIQNYKEDVKNPKMLEHFNNEIMLEYPMLEYPKMLRIKNGYTKVNQ